MIQSIHPPHHLSFFLSFISDERVLQPTATKPKTTETATQTRVFRAISIQHASNFGTSNYKARHLRTEWQVGLGLVKRPIWQRWQSGPKRCPWCVVCSCLRVFQKVCGSRSVQHWHHGTVKKTDKMCVQQHHPPIGVDNTNKFLF